jgi:hypothetical protein
MDGSVTVLALFVIVMSVVSGFLMGYRMNSHCTSIILDFLDRRRQRFQKSFLKKPLKGGKTIFSEAMEKIADDHAIMKSVSITLVYKDGTVIELREPPAGDTP